MIKFLKYFRILFLMIIIIIAIVFAIAQIKYPDKTQYIKPIAIELLKNSKFIKNEENKLLSKNAVIDLLKKSGCEELSDISSNIVKTKIENVTNRSNHWFSAICTTNENKALNVQITLREDNLPDFFIYFEHSYCFSVMHKTVKCFTQTIITLPSGH